eukprot:TRINITY_DN4416_c0_g2_i1.p1 TRINITY_DN4416_c0_g2~~TRINITY_DN4416_c0_g2_i1.p1  ORF type:complete len:395 (-),score=83.05 TRINITY_DN4416_c0_g2_i1:205-1389(-)
MSKNSKDEHPSTSVEMTSSRSFKEGDAVVVKIGDDVDLLGLPSSHDAQQHRLRTKMEKAYIPMSLAAIRMKTFLILSEPKYSLMAFVIALIVISAICISVVMLLLSTLPQFWSREPRVFWVMETMTVVIFTVEYVLKFVSAPSPLKWAFEPLSVIDLCSIVPYYVELVIPDNLNALAVVRILRLVRIFRVIKLGAVSETFRIIGTTARRSRDGLGLLCFLVLIVLVCFSTMLFYAESLTGGQYFDASESTWYRDDGSVSPFQSIPGCFWWCVVTITTVGYGDAAPVTWAGKLVGSITAISGVLVLAFPITIFSTNFAAAWQESKDVAAMREQFAKIETILPPDTTTISLIESLERNLYNLSKRLQAQDDALKESLQLHNEMAQVVSFLKAKHQH